MSGYSSGPPTWRSPTHAQQSQRLKDWVYAHPFLTALVSLVVWGLIWTTMITAAAVSGDPDPAGSVATDDQTEATDSSQRDDASDDRARDRNDRPQDGSKRGQDGSDRPRKGDDRGRSNSAQQATPGTGAPRDRGPSPRRLYAVLDVVDGDTVHVAYRGDTTIRVIGIDTPRPSTRLNLSSVTDPQHQPLPSSYWPARGFDRYSTHPKAAPMPTVAP